MSFKEIFSSYWNEPGPLAEQIHKFLKIRLNCKPTLLGKFLFYCHFFFFFFYELFINIFIRIRDEACGHGEILQSRALMYTQSDLLKSVEKLKTIKQESEVKYFLSLNHVEINLIFNQERLHITLCLVPLPP